MIHTTVCVSLAQGKKKLLEFTQSSGDPFSQDWLICTHPESVKWVSQTLASERGLCAQVEIYPVGRWVSALQSVVWPSMSQLPSLNRMVWATLEGGSRLGQSLGPNHEVTRLFGTQVTTNSDPIAQRRARRRGRALSSKRLGTAQRFAKILRRLLLNRPHWLQLWDKVDLEEIETQDIWPHLWKSVSDVLGPISKDTLAPDSEDLALWSDWLELLCRRTAHPSSGLAQQVRRIVFIGHHRYDAQTLALARACAQVVEVAFLSIDPVNHARQGKIDLNDMDTTLPLLNSFGGGFTAHLSPMSHSTEEQKALERLRPYPPFPITPPPLATREELQPTIAEPISLLQLFQQALSLGSQRPEAPQKSLSHLQDPSEDHSFKFHTSYSDQRQVEDLYQTLMAAFRRDPTLRPRDVLVLCSDIERFAPLILAVFNGGMIEQKVTERSNKPVEDVSQTVDRLGAELARPHGQNPYAHFLTMMLKLSKSRLYRHDVFQCLKYPLVSARYHLSLDAVIKLEQWIRLSGVRWGLDAAHRVQCGLNEEAQHSWEFGLDRLLMGTLVGDDQYRGLGDLYGGVAPMSLGNEETEVYLSRFFEFFLMLTDKLSKLSSSHTPAVWCELLIDLLRNMTMAKSTEDKALRQDVESDLRRALKRQAPTQQRMTNKAIALLIEQGIGQQRMVQGAGRDHVKFYSLDQSYGVPAKVICFLNLSEGQFPYRSQIDRFDPLKMDPLPTDLDPIQEQFANLLTSLLAAQEQVHFFYTGQKANGETKLPAPILQAIQEELATRYQIGTKVSDQLIEALTIQHPLHSFSPRNFVADFDGNPSDVTISHEPIWLKGAQAWRHSMNNPSQVPPFSEKALEAAARGVNRPRLDTLNQLLKNPSEFFLKRGVGMQLLKDQELNRERELLELDGIQSWSLKDRTFKLLMAMDPSLENKEDLPSVASPLTDDHFQRIIEIVRAEGLLPIGKMGEVSFEQALDEVKSLYERFTVARHGAKRSPLSLQHRLPSGRPIYIEGDMCYGNRLVFTTPSRHTAKSENGQSIRGERLIEPWVYHVALSAVDHEFKGTTLVAKDGQFDRFPVIPRDRAVELLEQWVDLMEEGTLQPLRFDPEVSWKWLNIIGQQTLDSTQIEAFQSQAEQWKRADDLYVQQAYSGGTPWQINETFQSEKGSAEDKDQAKGEKIHPEFVRQSEIIFGDLSAALIVEED